MAGRVPVLALLLPVALLSGCGRVSEERGRERWKAAVEYEASEQPNYEGAAKAYAEAARSSIPQAATAQAAAARVLGLAGKYQQQVDAYRALAQRADARVNIAPPAVPLKWDERNEMYLPVDERLVRDWIGTPYNQIRGGPWYEAEQQLDRANRNRLEYRFLDGLVKATGSNPWYSYALAILAFTFIVKLLLTPLTVSQYKQMMKMQKVQPLMKEIQEKYKDKPEEMNRAVMALYREQGVNPLGCGLSLIVQMPILIFLYRVIQEYTAQFRNGHFLWINPEMADKARGIVGANLASPDWPLLLLYALSMYVSQKMTTLPATDPQTKQQQQMMAVMMPVMFLFVLQNFPSAFLLYWFVFNVLSTMQTKYLMKKHAHDLPVPAAVPVPVEPSVNVGPSRTPKKRRKR